MLGTAFALVFHYAYFLPLFLVLYTNREKLLSGVLVCALSVVLALLAYTLPELKEEGLEGKGDFTFSAFRFVKDHVDVIPIASDEGSDLLGA